MQAKLSTRNFDLAIAAWLGLSAFLWSHSHPQFNNAWVVGLLAAALAQLALTRRWLRWSQTALGVWVIMSVWTLETFSPTTVWNNVMVGMIMLTASVVSRPDDARTMGAGTR